MIEQFLNREYVISIAAAVAKGVAHEADARASGGSDRRGPGAPDPLAEVTTRELHQFAEALAELPELQARSAKKRPSAEPPRADEAELPQEDSVYIPRSRMLSLVQSAVEAAVVDRQPEAIEEPRPQYDDERRGGRSLPTITDRRLKDVPPVALPGRRIWKPFEMATGAWTWLSDPRWVYSYAHKLWRDATDDIVPFVDVPPTISIADNARIFLVGDWGTGLDRAVRVAKQISEEMTRGHGRQQVVVHLGDVYYSGTEREVRDRFLGPWPVTKPDEALSFNLMGNHDMYSGGHGYYRQALADPLFARQGGCSYFALRNDHWQFLGLDTAYEDGGLHAEQGPWAQAAALDARRATVLLSHHQPFSAYGDGYKLLRKKVAPVLETGRVAAWFWGHEHRCIQYGPTTVEGAPLPFSSCLGHGGVPQYVEMKEGETRPAPWEYEYLKVTSDSFQPWDTFGFAVLELDGPAMSVRYIDEHGVNHHTVARVPRGPR